MGNRTCFHLEMMKTKFVFYLVKIRVSFSCLSKPKLSILQTHNRVGFLVLNGTCYIIV